MNNQPNEKMEAMFKETFQRKIASGVPREQAVFEDGYLRGQYAALKSFENARLRKEGGAGTE